MVVDSDPQVAPIYCRCRHCFCVSLVNLIWRGLLFVNERTCESDAPSLSNKYLVKLTAELGRMQGEGGRRVSKHKHKVDYEAEVVVTPRRRRWRVPPAQPEVDVVDLTEADSEPMNSSVIGNNESHKLSSNGSKIGKVSQSMLPIPGWVLDDAYVSQQDVLRLEGCVPLRSKGREDGGSPLDESDPEGNHLGENIVEFIAKLIYKHMLTEEQRSRCYIFSPSFYTLICGMEPPPRNVKDLDANFACEQNICGRVRRWTASLRPPLVQRAKIFMPIVSANHWKLVVISNVCKAERGEPGSFCTVFDPLFSGTKRNDALTEAIRRENKQIILTVLTYLSHIFQHDVSPIIASEPRSSGLDICRYIEHLPDCYVPQQDNGFDCSLFVLEYISLIATDKVSLKDSNSPIASKWFDQRLITHRRKELTSMFQLMREFPLWESDANKIRQISNRMCSAPKGCITIR